MRPAPMVVVLGMIALFGVAGCARAAPGGGGDVDRNDAAVRDAAVSDAPDKRDAATADASIGDASAVDASAVDARVVDAPGGTDADVDPPIDAQTDGGTGLDPDLELPDPAGAVCARPGAAGFNDCDPPAACRFYTPTEGRCEDCQDCRGLGMPCSVSSDCDSLAVCFRGRCSSFCRLGSPECGGQVSACLSIGHATVGVCDPDQ